MSRRSVWRTFGIGARMRSSDALDRMAWEASSGEYTWERMRREIELDGSREQLDQWEHYRVVAAAVLHGVLDPTPARFDLAVKVLRNIPNQRCLAPQGGHHVLRLGLQMAAMRGAFDVVRHLSTMPFAEPDVIWAAELDGLRPSGEAAWAEARTYATGKGKLPANVDTWWRRFNELIIDAGLEPFELDLSKLESENEIFGAVHAPRVGAATVPVHEQPLVSVIVPTYNPESSFLRTIESLVWQSWTNLEILVMDDRSTAGHEFLQAATEIDSRVRVIQMPENGGAYRARNAGLLAASGEYVTFQDADDISHTRRVEYQIAPLLADDALVATESRAQRAVIDGSLTFLGYTPHRSNASSMFFRRELVLETLGGFDGVRKGGDSEFAQRLTAAFGPDAIRRIPEVLALVQLTIGSLSRSDFRHGWMSGNRVSYVHQYRRRHREIAASEQPDWRLTPDDPYVSWSAPGMRGRKPAQTLEFAVLGDWRLRVETPTEGERMLREHVFPRATRPVGLVNGVAPRFSSLARDAVAEGLTLAVEQGDAQWVNWIDQTHIETLIVADPEYLMYLPDATENGLTVSNVEIRIAQSLRNLRQETSPLLAPLEWCEERVQHHFGVAPTWVTESRAIADYLRAKNCPVRLDEWSGPVPITPLSTDKRPVIGLVLPMPEDQARWLPERLATLVPDPSLAEILLFDQFGYSRIEWQDPIDFTGWSVVHGDDCTVDEFLARVDILVPDLFAHGLQATSTWVRRAGGVGVRTVLPRRALTEYGDRVMTYAPEGSRDLLSLLAIRGGSRRIGH
ncbi:glycosyltransferase family 2 protein [Leucobacter sp. HY1910]